MSIGSFKLYTESVEVVCGYQIFTINKYFDKYGRLYSYKIYKIQNFHVHQSKNTTRYLDAQAD